MVHPPTVVGLSAGQVRRVLPVAIVLTWFGPFSVDAYSPAFPMIQADLGTSPGLVQLTLAATLVGLTVGQLIVGPLSDRFGRLPPLVIGLAGYVLASLFCALAWSIEALVVARTLQGLTAATGIVIARATGRDVHSGPELGRFFSVIAAATALAPMVAPIMGAWLLQAGLSWRWIFGLTLVLGLVGLVLAATVLPETHPTRATQRLPSAPTDPGVRLLRQPHVLAAAGVIGLCGGAMLANLAGLSFYLQEQRGTSPLGYAMAFAAGAVTLVASGNVNRLLQRRFEPQQLMSVSVPAMLVFTVLLGVAQRSAAPLGIVVLLVCAFMGMWGFVLPNALALGMAVDRRAAGRAAALLGAAQYGFASVTTPLVGVIPALAGVPAMATVMTGCVAGATVIHFSLLGRARRSATRLASDRPPTVRADAADGPPVPTAGAGAQCDGRGGPCASGNLHTLTAAVSSSDALDVCDIAAGTDPRDG